MTIEPERRDLTEWIITQGALHPGLHTALATALGPRDPLAEAVEAKLAEDTDLAHWFMGQGEAS